MPRFISERRALVVADEVSRSRWRPSNVCGGGRLRTRGRSALRIRAGSGRHERTENRRAGGQKTRVFHAYPRCQRSDDQSRRKEGQHSAEQVELRSGAYTLALPSELVDASRESKSEKFEYAQCPASLRAHRAIPALLPGPLRTSSSTPPPRTTTALEISRVFAELWVFQQVPSRSEYVKQNHSAKQLGTRQFVTTRT